MPLRSPPGLHRRPVFQPQCTHLTMTRLYSPDILCGTCHCPGPLGWLYQCTQDRDEVIEQAVCRGELVNMDELGCHLSSKLDIRLGSPAAREDRFSFFNEITQKQMANYRPDQIVTILKQRENVQFVIQRDKIRKNSAAILERLTQPNGTEPVSNPYEFQKPWVCAPHEECQYLVCPRCRPGSSDRAFLSLNAVANGETSPTAAVGYGFHAMGERPVVDVELLRNIGCRPVPVPCLTPSSDNDTRSSFESVMELLEAQIARGRVLLDKSRKNTPADGLLSEVTWPLNSNAQKSHAGQLKHSPRCDNLGAFSAASDPLIWTPPPSPGFYEKEAAAVHDSTKPGLEYEYRLVSSHRGSEGEQGNKFGPSPLKVGHGVAMLEESVELGVPDVITQI